MGIRGSRLGIGSCLLKSKLVVVAIRVAWAEGKLGPRSGIRTSGSVDLLSC